MAEDTSKAVYNEFLRKLENEAVESRNGLLAEQKQKEWDNSQKEWDNSAASIIGMKSKSPPTTSTIDSNATTIHQSVSPIPVENYTKAINEHYRDSSTDFHS